MFRIHVICIQENVSVSQQRQLAIQAELQQIEMKQQRSLAQRQHDSMQRQMSVNIPSGYGISQHEQNMQQLHQSMNIEQPRSIPAPTGTARQHSVPMMPQHPMDPSRPRSHQGAMSPALLGSTQHTLPINQRAHQGHSPHPTPPPALFSRQASVPVLPVMQNQPSMQSDTMGAHLMPTQMQSQGITNVMGQQAHPKGIGSNRFSHRYLNFSDILNIYNQKVKIYLHRLRAFAVNSSLSLVGVASGTSTDKSQVHSYYLDMLKSYQNDSSCKYESLKEWKLWAKFDECCL